MGNELYQIGLPVASLSTVLMDWTCFNRPEKLLISPAKKDEWAVVELRNPELAAAIIKDVPEAMVKVVQQPVSYTHLDVYKRQIKEKCMKDRLKIDDAARTFFEDYRYDKAGEMVSLTERKKEEYTINASVLNELISILNDREGYRKALGGSTKKVWETIIGTADRLRDSYGHTRCV